MKKAMIVAGCSIGFVVMAIAGDKPQGTRPEGLDRHPGMGMGMMEGGMPMMPLMHMFKEIGLSQDQEQKIKEVFSGSGTEMKTLHSKMQAALKAQSDLMNQDSPDEVAVLKSTGEISQIRAEIDLMSVKQRLAIHKILTVEQRAKMRQTMKEHMEKRDWMKPGGEGHQKEHGKNAVCPKAGPAPEKSPEAKTE